MNNVRCDNCRRYKPEHLGEYFYLAESRDPSVIVRELFVCAGCVEVARAKLNGGAA